MGEKEKIVIGEGIHRTAEETLAQIQRNVAHAFKTAQEAGVAEFSIVVEVDMARHSGPPLPKTQEIFLAMACGRFRAMNKHDLEGYAGMEGRGFMAEINNHVVVLDITENTFSINIQNERGELFACQPLDFHGTDEELSHIVGTI